MELIMIRERDMSNSYLPSLKKSSFFTNISHAHIYAMPLAPTEVHAKRVRSLFSLIIKQKEDGGKHANTASFIFCRFAFTACLNKILVIARHFWPLTSEWTIQSVREKTIIYVVFISNIRVRFFLLD